MRNLKSIPNEITKNFKESETKVKLMKEYGDGKFPYSGINEDGEKVEVSIAPDSIIVSTFQSNGWLRKNYYDKNGFDDGETFEGRWK